MQETWVQSLGQEAPPEKETETCSSVLVLKIPWTEESGRLQTMGLQKGQLQFSDYTTTYPYSLIIHLGSALFKPICKVFI